MVVDLADDNEIRLRLSLGLDRVMSRLGLELSQVRFGLGLELDQVKFKLGLGQVFIQNCADNNEIIDGCRFCRWLHLGQVQVQVRLGQVQIRFRFGFCADEKKIVDRLKTNANFEYLLDNYTLTL